MDRKLHIGGTIAAEGWEVFNILPGPHVDHIGNAKNLSQFPDSTFTAIYASHVLEHFDYKNELPLVLKEWHRVLCPGGKVYISVPDLDILSTMFVRKDAFSLQDRFHIMRMMFGGHVTEYDYHIVGLNQEFLSYFLNQAGYVNFVRVKEFGFFNDTSTLLFKGIPISLNIQSEKPAM